MFWFFWVFFVCLHPPPPRKKKWGGKILRYFFCFFLEGKLFPNNFQVVVSSRSAPCIYWWYGMFEKITFASGKLMIQFEGCIFFQLGGSTTGPTIAICSEYVFDGSFQADFCWHFWKNPGISLFPTMYGSEIWRRTNSHVQCRWCGVEQKTPWLFNRGWLLLINQTSTSASVIQSKWPNLIP